MINIPILPTFRELKQGQDPTAKLNICTQSLLYNERVLRTALQTGWKILFGGHSFWDGLSKEEWQRGWQTMDHFPLHALCAHPQEQLTLSQVLSPKLKLIKMDATIVTADLSKQPGVGILWNTCRATCGNNASYHPCAHFLSYKRNNVGKTKSFLPDTNWKEVMEDSIAYSSPSTFPSTSSPSVSSLRQISACKLLWIGTWPIMHRL